MAFPHAVISRRRRRFPDDARLFGEEFKVADNTKAIIDKTDPTEECAQERGFVIDPARFFRRDDAQGRAEVWYVH